MTVSSKPAAASTPKTNRSTRSGLVLGISRWTYGFTGFWLALVTAAAFLDVPLIRLLEHQSQTLFFELKGPVVPPDDIVLLTIDDESLSQGEHYLSEPEAYADLAPIQQWPWQRQAYAIAIEKLIAAGAKAVALDVVLSLPSSYGEADDQALAAVLQRFGDRVVLAATYGEIQMAQGQITKPVLPIPQLLDTPIQVGAIHFPLEADSRIHRQGRVFIDEQVRRNADVDAVSELTDAITSALSFAEATLKAAQIDYVPTRGDHIYFHGPAGTFKQVPFWYVIDDDPWQNTLDAGAYFKDKIVLIGSTSQLHQDFHAAPFSGSLLYPTPMAGLEILANDLATLQQGKSVWVLSNQAWQRGVSILLVGAAFGVLLSCLQRPLTRILCTGSTMLLWVGFGFGCFLAFNVFVPVTSPVLAIGVIGGANLLASLAGDQFKKQKLRSTLAQYVTSPIVQEIISQQDEFQDLLEVREAQVIGKVLGDRYQVTKLLGSGGFGETYIAQDLQRPHHPTCVVKQLKIVSDNPKMHHLAQRLFTGEAETLEKLGQHDQIPRLLAYFEANQSFYLVQEMIEGKVLRDELDQRRTLSQADVYALLVDLLPVIAFVHAEGVIHRDIKPSNIIRRASDNRLVLIDFGAVKQISNRLTSTSARLTSTIGIGTQGYMPSEQSAGIPNFSSDIYALGITAIEALTGTLPQILQRDAAGEIVWTHKIENLNPQLCQILKQMTRYDFSQRYRSAQEILNDLAQIQPDQLPHTEIEPTQPTASDRPPHQVVIEAHSSQLDSGRSDEPATEMLPSDWEQQYSAEQTIDTEEI
ncbi:CHASE2 domain-containing protein [Almyronema epifaneia]|uniref:non-specific serine/threonine protein kinase n=1 Tax=Almyronema epifaneia S1 TaxID=2991925 RepID=A0ABW6IFD2_9CYAN